MAKHVLCLTDSYNKKIVVPITGNEYIFFRGRTYLVKNEKDIAYFRENKHLFSIEDEAVVDVETEKPEPIESFSETKKKGKKKKTDSDE